MTVERVVRVLMSAFACEPGKGSEPEIGLRALLAAAEQHTVWVLTDSAGAPSLQRFLAGTRWGPVSTSSRSRWEFAPRA